MMRSTAHSVEKPARANSLVSTRTSHIKAVAISVFDCWCGSGTWQARIAARRFAVLKCSNCGVHRIDPVPLQSSEESESFYTKYYRKVGTGVRPIQTPSKSRLAGFWRVADKYEPLYQVGRRVVDIGCGDGHLCAELSGQGWPSVVGVDISKTRVARARELYPNLTFFDTPLAKVCEKQSLDLIVMEALIEHLLRPMETMREYYEFLAPGGRIVLTTPNMDSGEFRFLGKRWTSMLAPHAHIFLFSPASIRRLLSEAGFNVEAVGNYHTPLYRPIDYVKRMARGDLKGTLWRAHQDLGVVYGRMIGSSSMLFAVGRKPQ
jgi:SAM-dependent methyltransferase